MAITANTYNVESIPSASKRWFVSLASEDISGAEDIKAAESGWRHYLTKLVIRADAAMDITVGSGETGSAVTTVHLGPIPLDATSAIVVWNSPVEKWGLKFTDELAIVVDSTAAGTIWIEASGYTAKIG